MLYKLFFLLTLVSISFGQYIPESKENKVYDFLENLDTKNIIKINSEAKPFSRTYIIELLMQVHEKKDQLNNIESEDLFWFLKDFNVTINDSTYDRWRVLKYRDNNFNFELTPIAGYSLTLNGNKNGKTQLFGIKAWGSYGSGFSSYINFTDKGEFGDNVDKQKFLTPATGRENKGAPNGIEYSDVIGGISLDWKWSNLTLAKDYNFWGHGTNGNLILGNKTPSYPFVKFEVNPVEWFRFKYIFAWLNSQVIDSSFSYNAAPNSKYDLTRERFIDKYFVINMFTFNPWSWLDLSVGNSLVYSSDNIRLETLIPFMFFKYLDRDVGKGSIEDGNGALFFDIGFNYLDNYKFYTTLFADVIGIRNTLEGKFHENWFAYTFGVKAVDLFTNNLNLNIEYTRIDPWVYEHKDITTTYKHLDYTLGHWLGQNGDNLKITLNYRFIRELKIETYLEKTRKGGLKDIYYAYNAKTEGIQPFLYGPLRKDFYIGLKVNYEPIHSLNTFLHYYYSDINDEDISRTPKFLLGSKHNLNIGFTYGL